MLPQQVQKTGRKMNGGLLDNIVQDPLVVTAISLCSGADHFAYLKVTRD